MPISQLERQATIHRVEVSSLLRVSLHRVSVFGMLQVSLHSAYVHSRTDQDVVLFLRLKILFTYPSQVMAYRD